LQRFVGNKNSHMMESLIGHATPGGLDNLSIEGMVRV
jgi:hypothetical protein